METLHYSRVIICLSFFLTLLCFTGQGLAADYNTSANFTANDVSTVAPGDSQEFTLIDEYWGFSWDEEYGVGDPKLGDGLDNDPSFGYYVGVGTSGNIGIGAKAVFDYGTMDISAPLDINLHTSATGQTTSVATDYSIGANGGFTTSGTEGGLGVYFNDDYSFGYVVSGAVGGYTASTHQRFGLDVISLPEDLLYVDQNNGPKTESFIGGTINISGDIPNIVAQGNLGVATGLNGYVSSATRTASNSHSANILSLSVDADKILTALTGIPTSLAINETVDIPFTAATLGASITATLFDAEIGANVDLSQDFTVLMNPRIQLEFSEPVRVWNAMEGRYDEVMVTDAALGRDIEILAQGIVSVTPTYSLEWTVTNDTKVNIVGYAAMTIGELSGSVSYGTGSASIGIGPLFQQEYSSPLGDISVYDNRWTVAGEDIGGDLFRLNLNSDLVTMLDKAIDEINQTFAVTGSSLAARDNLGTIIQNKNTATTPAPDEPKDLFTENSDLYWFLANNYNRDGDSEQVDYLDGFARGSLLDILKDYDPANANYFDFLLDVTGIFNLGIDFQPLFDDTGLLVTGLVASFYNLDFLSGDATGGGTIGSYNPYIALSDVPLLEDLGLDNLLGTSFAFFYNDLVGMTDLTVYQNSAADPASFAYAYSSLEQFIEPVPEPATIILLGSGLIGLAWYRRKRKNVQ